MPGRRRRDGFSPDASPTSFWPFGSVISIEVPFSATVIVFDPPAERTTTVFGSGASGGPADAAIASAAAARSERGRAAGRAFFMFGSP